MKTRIVGLILIAITLSCQTDKTPLSLQNRKNEKPIHYTRTISGYVQMEHQTNHDNCAVFLDQVNIGAYTDSSGFYSITLLDSAFENDTLKIQGQVKLYFYSYNFYMDSLSVALGEEGIIQDSLDVDINGQMNLTPIKQIVKIELITDTSYYQIGDTINMELILTGMTTDTFYCEIIHSTYPFFGPVYFIHENNVDWSLEYNPTNSQTTIVFRSGFIPVKLYGVFYLTQSFFNQHPEGNYSILPHIAEISFGENFSGQGDRYIPKNFKKFLPPSEYLSFDLYYKHPKKIICPKVFLKNQ